ncbi:MAG: alpha/beta hydrolase [Polaribacter sp.]|nr:MAG: alpha/beta hydrolase [Polaribacter sp.]
MTEFLKTEGKFTYAEAGEGTPIVILHGLMGALSNFGETFKHFTQKGYRVIIPELPLYTLPILKTNVKNLSKFLHEFLEFKNLDNVILVGNSLGGHIALYYIKHNPQDVCGLVLTGSSGLYENSMGSAYPRRGDKSFVRKKAEEVFYDKSIATDELVDEVYEVINNRNTLIKTLAIAKSAVRHNMAKDLPNMTQPTCLIWGKNDTVTPPEVAEDFEELLPNSTLYWIDKCGHAPMMEHPHRFNDILEEWLIENNL